MSPILLRPIREQIEHDRVIRQLQARWKRRYEVAINTGQQEEHAVRSSGQDIYPDVILTSVDGPRRLHAVVEVETAESVNHLEAMAQWAHFARARGVFYLYVPAGLADVARRLCQGSDINVTEIWTYYVIGDQIRFSMTYRSPRAKLAAKAAAARPTPAKKKARTVKRSKANVSRKPATKSKVETRRAPDKKKATKKAKKKR